MLRAAKIEVLKYIHSPCTSPQASPFSIAELNSCISDVDGSAASGLDQMETWCISKRVDIWVDNPITKTWKRQITIRVI